MGAYDNVYVHDDVAIDVEGLPIDPRRDDTGRPRAWQTKGLHPSMDCYAIRPYRGRTDGRPCLYRRHPPVWRWTEHNKGAVNDEIDVFGGADHWRRVKATTAIEMSEAVAGEGGLTIYTLEAMFELGVLEEIGLVETEWVEATVVPTDERDE